MYIKLVKSFLAITLLLIGMNGTAIGGECEDVLDRMQNILNKRVDDTTAGTVPDSLLSLPKDENISVIEDSNSPEKIEREGGSGYCFKFSGKWSNNMHIFEKIRDDFAEYNYPSIIAYVFFKSPSSDGIKNNLEINSSYGEDKSRNRVIALTAKHREDGQTAIAGAISNDRPENLKEKIIWLPVDSQKGQNKSIEVVLCEGPCRNFIASSNSIAPIPDRTEPDGETSTEEQGPPTGTEPKISDKDLKEMQDQHRNEINNLKRELENKRQKIEKEAITKFINSRIDFQFEDMNGNKVEKLKRNDLKPKECKPPKIKTKNTLKKKMRSHYKKCYSIPDFDIKEAMPIIKGNTLAIIYKLKKSTPSKIKHIEISVKMEDKSQATQSCAVTAKIVDSSTNKPVFEQPFPFIFDSKEQTLFLEFKNPIAWKGKSLVLEKGEETDCQPKNGELRIPMKEIHVTKKAVLKIPKITLYSTLGNALIVLNTMIGVEALNGVKPSTQFYPIANDELSRELLTVMVAQSLEKLRGKVNGLTVALSRQDGPMKFINYSDDFKKMKPDRLANIIVNEVRFVQGDFVWSTMLNTVKREVKNLSDYTYQLFIGQSGLSDETDYCENSHSSWQQLKQEPVTFIYDFASDDNDYNPLLKDLESVDRKFPLLNCPVSNNISVHVVLFPQSKKGGWDTNISTLFSNAFKDH